MTNPNMRAQQPNPMVQQLMGRYDADPGPWRPLYYSVPISVGQTADSVGRGSITLNNQPYIMTHISHQIAGNTADPTASGLYQDGQYTIEFKDEQSNYMNSPAPADMLFGSVRSGYNIPLSYPIAFAGNKTLTFEIVNLYTRTLVPDAPFTVYVGVHGIAYWGELYPKGP